ncbi:LysM peptidoglycan-binding domain-containing protein [Thalassotalea piscium]
MVKEYIVKPGDTLWDISTKYLGSPWEWPRLWRFNNRKEVIAITKRPIVNPDLIYPGQKILLPILDKKITPRKDAGKPQVKPHTPFPEPLNKQLPKITSPISLSYRLEDITQPPIILPNAIVEVKMTGSVTLSSVEKYPVNYVVNDKKLETTITTQANHAFGALLGETKLAFDEKTKKLTLGSKIISKSSTPNAPSSAVGIELSSNSPIPKLKYEIRLPQLKGKINQFNYVAEKVTFILEVTFTTGGDTGTYAPRTPQPDSSPSWDKVLAVGLFATATVIVVGTLIEDYVTLGAGTVDDPASFAAAAGLTARGSLLWATANTVVITATLPAIFKFSTSIVPEATLQ